MIEHSRQWHRRTARRFLAGESWGAEVFKLSGSVELAPLLGLGVAMTDVEDRPGEKDQFSFGVPHALAMFLDSPILPRGVA